MEIIKLPLIGLSEESAIIFEWYVKQGDTVAVGDKLCSIENGKSTYDVAAEVSGTVLAVLEEEGVELPIETPILVIGGEGETYEAAPRQAEQALPVPQDSPSRPPPQAAPPQAAPPPQADGHIAASPRAKALAVKAGVDLALVRPSGPEGLIIEADVRRAIAQGAAPAVTPATAPEQATRPAQAADGGRAAYRDIRISNTRKVIAENMHKSTSEMAHSSMTTSFDATELLRFKEIYKQSGNPAYSGITIGDMVMYGIVRTVLDYKVFNSHFLWEEKVLRQFEHVHLGVAVDTPAGLMVPTIPDADCLRLHELAAEVKRLAAACRDGSVRPAELRGSSITVSNLGAAGAESFSPIVNPPQVAIVGICRTQYRPRPDGNGGFAFYPAMPLSLTIDHRAADGLPASLFMKQVCTNLEHYAELLA